MIPLKSHKLFQHLYYFFRISLPRSIRSSILFRAFIYLGCYVFWILFFKSLVLTLLTYYFRITGGKLQDITDTWNTNELTLVGLSTGIYLVLLCLLYPLTSTSILELTSWQRIKRQYLPGFFSGFALGMLFLLALWSAQLFRFLGLYFQLDEASLLASNLFPRMIAIALLISGELYLFQYKLFNPLRRSLGDIGAAVLIATLACLVKELQFDLSYTQLFTFLLLTFFQCIKTAIDGDFHKSAGITTGFFILFHPWMSLQILGNEFQGIFLTKIETSSEAWGTEGLKRLARWMSGGPGGPLSSGIFQLILLTACIALVYRNYRFLRPRKHPTP